jgi:hypothetical protein
MEMWMWIAIAAGVAVVAIALVAIAVVRMRRKHRAEAYRAAFGPEYDRTVKEKGRAKAEADLDARQRYANEYPIRALNADEARQFSFAWREINAHFLDAPAEATAQADRLVQEVMHTRGYPVLDFERSAGILSVQHPRIAATYHEAHDTAVRNQHRDCNTEELRQAMVGYRAILSELLLVGAPEQAGIDRDAALDGDTTIEREERPAGEPQRPATAAR